MQKASSDYPVKLGALLCPKSDFSPPSSKSQNTFPNIQRQINKFHTVAKIQSPAPQLTENNTPLKEIHNPIINKRSTLSENFIRTATNTFGFTKKNTFNEFSKKNNLSLSLKNTYTNFNSNNIKINYENSAVRVPGCTPYDPYLIDVCKKAIINVKDELPNYQEIISKINQEFGIEEEKEEKMELLITEPVPKYNRKNGFNDTNKIYKSMNKANKTVIDGKKFFGKKNVSPKK